MTAPTISPTHRYREGRMSAQPDTAATRLHEAQHHVALMRTLAAADGKVDPRDPLLRLAAFFDPGSVVTLSERDRSGFLAAAY